MGKQDWIRQRVGELDDDKLKELLDDITDREAVSVNPHKHELVHIQDIGDDIEHHYQNWGKMVGLSTGFTSLDLLTKGMNAGEVILIAGATSSGKSALASNIACAVSKNGHGVLYVTLEMLKEEIGTRFRYINNGTIENLDIMFQLEHSIDYRDIEPLIDKGLEVGVDLVVIDYLQYLARAMTLEEVAKMSKELKRMALKAKIPVIVITQIRKGDRMRKWTDIEIDDIMGTSAIGYDCDIALLTSRRNINNEFVDDLFTVKILKNRNRGFDGEHPYAELVWDKTRVTDKQ